jgi:hypothetical protein
MISVYCIAWDGLSFVELKNGVCGGYVETLYQVAALLFPEHQWQDSQEEDRSQN